MNFKGKMVQEDGFVPFKQKPIFYPLNDRFFHLFLFEVFEKNTVDIFLPFDKNVRIFIFHDRFVGIGHLDLFNNFFVFEIDLVHFDGHFNLVLRYLVGNLHAFLHSFYLRLQKQFMVKNLCPRNSISSFILQHFLHQLLKLLVF